MCAEQQSLRQQIAIVPQEPILLDRSLAENIACARPAATTAEIEAAALLANAHDFIARLPKGFRTLVGERCVKLSGGEQQRVRQIIGRRAAARGAGARLACRCADPDPR
jgi:ATP-binding cassette subfamily B protein